MLTFVKLSDLHEFTQLIYRPSLRFTRGNLHLSLRFTRVQIYKFSKTQRLALICNFWRNEIHIDSQARNQHVFRKWKCFEATCTFWYLQNFHLLIMWKKQWKKTQKGTDFRWNYTSRKTSRLKHWRAPQYLEKKSIGKFCTCFSLHHCSIFASTSALNLNTLSSKWFLV